MLVVATIQWDGRDWHFVPAASTDFVLEDGPLRAKYLEYGIEDFLDRTRINAIYARRLSVSQRMPAHVNAHRLMSLFESVVGTAVPSLHPATIAAWRTREEPTLPSFDRLRHNQALSPRHAFAMFDRAVETACCAAMLREGRDG